jgi:glycerol 2-dehydrogenase (NADP+)
VILQWGIQKEWSVIPKSVNPDRIQANWQLDGWNLTPEEVKIIDDLPERFVVCDGTFLPDGVVVFTGDDE